MNDPLGWTSAAPGALPFGWTDAALVAVVRMARDLGVDPLEVLALFYSESGLNPHASGEGLAGLTSIVEQEMGWPSGTIGKLNASSQPIVLTLQALYQLWSRTREKYVGTSYAQRAAQWHVSPGTALYVYHGFLGPALDAGAGGGASAVLGVRPPVMPLTWGKSGWEYEGQPVALAIGRPLTRREDLYAGNPGLDRGSKGSITVGDMAARVASKAAALQQGATAPIADHLQAIASTPPAQLPTLAQIFGATAGDWKAITGTDAQTAPASEEHPNVPSPVGPALPGPNPAPGPITSEVSPFELAIVAAGLVLGWSLRRRLRR